MKARPFINEKAESPILFGNPTFCFDAITRKPWAYPPTRTGFPSSDHSDFGLIIKWIKEELFYAAHLCPDPLE